MALTTSTSPALPSDVPFPSEEARLAALNQALDEGDASPTVEGDIFKIVRQKYNLPPDNRLA